ncbi:hypothetical protein AB0J83_05305 [Actinoplanes sp. NPDC049596]
MPMIVIGRLTCAAVPAGPLFFVSAQSQIRISINQHREPMESLGMPVT